MNLNKEDINILIEAVDAWVSRDSTNDMMFDMMGVMMAKDKGQAEKVLNEREKSNKKEKILKEAKKEKATLLKTKLIEIKNSMNVESLIEDSKA